MAPEGVVDAEDVLGKRLSVDGRIELQLRIAWTEGLQLLHGLGAHRGNPPAGGKLSADVAQETLMARDHHLRRPVSRGDPQELELDGEKVGIALGLLDVRVDAVDVRVDDLDAPVVVVAQLLAGLCIN